jgi:cytochrome c-type biogenesis protein CcmH
LVLLPAGAVALYLMLGSPQLPGQPLAWRQGAAAENQSIESLVARVEDHVAHNPEDGRGWEVLAPVYLRLGRFDDAVAAWRNAIRLNGSSAAREARLGEALVAAHNGAVTGEAKAAFGRAAAIDPTDVMARFYLGMAADQDGRHAEAQAIWRDLLAKAPPDVPWAAAVRQALAQSAPPEAAPSLPGPSAADVAAASRMDPQAQKEMIGGMVARLADRMKQDGSDVEGWLRLLRAYAVLGERDKALAAVADARRALASDPDKLKRVDDLAKELGLQS